MRAAMRAATNSCHVILARAVCKIGAYRDQKDAQTWLSILLCFDVRPRPLFASIDPPCTNQTPSSIACKARSTSLCCFHHFRKRITSATVGPAELTCKSLRKTGQARPSHNLIHICLKSSRQGTMLLIWHPQHLYGFKTSNH